MNNSIIITLLVGIVPIVAFLWAKSNVDREERELEYYRQQRERENDAQQLKQTEIKVKEAKDTYETTKADVYDLLSRIESSSKSGNSDTTKKTDH